MKIIALTTAAALALTCGISSASADDVPKAWREPVKPFRVIGNIYYVGMRGVAAYLITSGRQAVLLDGTLAENVPSIEENIRSLGFELSDVKVLINSHAHYDHAAGLAQLKTDTGAQMIASAEDKWALENGTQVGDTNYGAIAYPPVKVDRVVKSGDIVKLGDVELEATVTPGHTKGCTTWSLSTVEEGRPLEVVFPCGVTVAGNILVGNRGYPEITADFEKTFDIFAGMKADVVLTGHPEQADVFGRLTRREAGEKFAFVDGDLLPSMVKTYRSLFEKELARAKSK